MKKRTKQHWAGDQRGFAIIVVLSSLLILTTLFGIASQRNMGQVQNQVAERILAQRQFENAELLTAQLTLDVLTVAEGTTALPPPFDAVDIRLQDVGGLIDLNTAAPELLEQLFTTLEFPNDAAATFREWRREGRRLMRVDDVLRITGADMNLLQPLLKLATVHSGRRGIATNVAPRAVIDIAKDVPETQPSRINYAVFRQIAEQDVLIGVVSMPNTSTEARFLEVR